MAPVKAELLSPARISQLIAPVLRRHPVLEAYIFGSRARGTSAPSSDVDLFCKVDRKTPFGIFALGSLTHDLQNALNVSVDVVTADSLEKTNPRLFGEIEKDKVKVYERA